MKLREINFLTIRPGVGDCDAGTKGSEGFGPDPVYILYT